MASLFRGIRDRAMSLRRPPPPQEFMTNAVTPSPLPEPMATVAPGGFKVGGAVRSPFDSGIAKPTPQMGGMSPEWADYSRRFGMHLRRRPGGMR